MALTACAAPRYVCLPGQTDEGRAVLLCVPHTGQVNR